MNSSACITGDQPHEWAAALEQCGAWDVFHTLAYHKIEEHLGHGRPFLIQCHSGGLHAALPLLVRPIPGTQTPASDAHCDAVSVYGYPGPLASCREPDPEFARRFSCVLRSELGKLGVVSLFSRLHPMIERHWLLDGLCAVVEHGSTVWMDLSQSEEEYAACCSREHRKQLRRVSGAGFTLRLDQACEHLDDFFAMYSETMRRTSAAPEYFFPRSYFESMIASLGHMFKLFFLEQGGKRVSGLIALACKPYLTFYLSGTPAEYLPLRCVRPLYDEIRRWARAEGYSWINLGGGVGNQSDSLFDFKASFSSIRRQFRTARLILNPAVYNDLTARMPCAQSASVFAGYFPAYRAPSPALSPSAHRAV